MPKESNEAPIISFRVPLDVITRLIDKGLLKPDYTKPELSNLIKNDWLAMLGEEVPIHVDARTVDAVYNKVDNVKEGVDAVYNRLDMLNEVLELLRSQSGKSRRAA